MNIVLIGMPGSGKSTIGVLLAKALGMEYVDTDIVIQQQQGRLLQEILEQDGIEKFLQIEEGIVSDLKLQNCVIATGGSVIYSEQAMLVLKQGGKIVYLHVPYEEIEKRLKNITTRGIVIKPGKSLKEVYQERLPLYIQYSDETMTCSAHKDVEDCVAAIAEKIQTF